MSKILTKLVREQADAAATRLGNAAVSLLIQSKHQMFGDDSGLENTWDEICVQVQGGEGSCWDAYEAAMRDAVLSALFSTEKTDREVIWLQSRQGWDWLWELENNDEDHETHGGRPVLPEIPVDDEDIVPYIISTQILPRAESFSSIGISRFLYPGDDSLEDDEDSGGCERGEVQAGERDNAEESRPALDIEYYDDSWNSDNYYVCINHHYIFSANRNDESPRWKLLNADYDHWDAIHQRIYRNFRSDKISREELPPHLPPPPETIPPEALNPPPPPPPKLHLVVDYPILSQYLSECEGNGTMAVFLQLMEDLYESLNGDGKFHYPEAIFFDLESARRGEDGAYRYHTRPGLIWLDGEEIGAEVPRRMFDHFSIDEVLKMVTEKIERDKGSIKPTDSQFV